MGYWRSTASVYAKGAFIYHNSNTGCANQWYMSTWHQDSADINPMHTGSSQTCCIHHKPNVTSPPLVQRPEVFLHCRSPCTRQGRRCTQTSYTAPKIWALSALCLCWTTLGNTRHGDLCESDPECPGIKTHTQNTGTTGIRLQLSLHNSSSQSTKPPANSTSSRKNH